MIVKNKKREEKISTILNKLVKAKIINNIYKENTIFYVEGKMERLKMIKNEIDIKIPRCDTDFVPHCFPDLAGPCDYWQPSKDDSEWCHTNCQNLMLEIETCDNVTTEYFISKCFDEVLNK